MPATKPAIPPIDSTSAPPPEGPSTQPSTSKIKPLPLPTRPPIDPSLAPILSSYPIPENLNLNLMRGLNLVPDGEPNPFDYTAATVLAVHPNFTHKEYTTTGMDNNDIVLSVFTPIHTSKSKVDTTGTTEHQDPNQDPKKEKDQALPALYHIHGGGLISGSRFSGVSETLRLLPPSCSFVTVEYRLAPETRAPGGAEDCYTGLTWLFAHAKTLGIDANRVVLYGVSGGGALAASVCLMARDRGLKGMRGVMLHTPMLDDRCQTTSDKQFERESPWSGTWNHQAWDLALGPGIRGTEQVTRYQAPAREANYSGLPPVYVDVAECEVFRDAAVTWAGEVWKAGGTCELHVWPGVWHIFDMMDGRDVPVVQMAVAAKRNWLGRMMIKGKVS